MTIRKGMALVIATLTTMGLWAEGEVTPLMLLNFKFENTPEVAGWINHFQAGGGTLPSNPNSYTINNVTFSTTSAGNFYQRAKVDTDFETGTYTDIFGNNHDSIVDEIKASLQLPDLELSEDVYKTGLMNGGQSGNTATISGLDAGSKYLLYFGYGLYKSDGPAQQCGFQIESSGCTSVKALDYVVTVNGTGTEKATSYTAFNVGTQIKPGSQGLMVVRLTNIVPTAAGEIKFKLYGDRSGMNWMAVAKVNTTAVTARAGGTVNWSEIDWSDDVTADSMLELTLTEDTTLTVDDVPSYSALKVKKDASVEGDVTLKIVAKNGVLNPALDEGVVCTDIELNAGASDTMKSSALTVPAGKTLTIIGTDDAENPLEITGILTVNGALKTKGQVKITNNDNSATGSIIETGATMEVVDGITVMKFNDRGMRGTLTIDADATLKPIDYVDACKYDGSSTVNVYGTLDMTDERGRWTLRQNNVMNFYPGSRVFGDGQKQNETTWHGALQFNSDNCVMNFKKDGTKTGTVRFDAKLRPNNPFTMNVEEDMIVEMAGSLGNDDKSMTVDGEGTVVVKSVYAFNAPVTVEETAKLVIETTGSLVKGAAGAGEVEFKSTEVALGTAYRAPLNLTLAAGTTEIALQATDAEMAAGSIAFKVTESLPADLTWTVTKADGGTVPVETTVDAEGNVTLTLGTKTYTESTATADWTDLAGRVTVMGPTEAEGEAVELTFNAELPEAVTEVYLGGKVVITAAADATLPSGKFHFLEGADVTVSNDLRAGETTVTPGATLRLRDVVLTKDIVVQGGATVIVEGAVTTPKIALAASNATLTVEPNAVLTVSANQAFSKANRGNGTFNIYGTIALGEYNWNHNFNGNTINCYAGGAIIGTTGQFICGGGSGTTYNLKDNPDSTERAFTFDVIMGEDFGDYSDTYACEANVGLKILKDNNRTSVCTITGTNINGLELAYGTFTISANDRCLRGAVKIAAGAKLILNSRHDLINYGSGVANPATLDIAGTLQCDARQTMFAENTVTLRDGAQITGTGGEHQSLMRAFDVCRDLSIAVEGTATMSAPFVFRDKRTISVNGTATSKLVLTEVTGNAQGVFKLTGGKLQLPAAVAEARVTTDVAGKMVKIAESTETSKTYRLAPKSFTISIK